MKRVLWASVVLAAACSATSPPVASSKPGNIDMKEARRMVGTENNVRVDAEIYGEELAQGSGVAIKYDITNQRPQAILIADITPQCNYDPDTRIVTIDIGSEIPGEELLPRLISIPSGARRSFKGGAHINIGVPAQSAYTPKPRALQLRINFLGNSAPFIRLVDIPEKSVRDRNLAAELFPKWVEGNETVTTNALPMRWTTGRGSAIDDNPVPPRRRRPG